MTSTQKIYFKRKYMKIKIFPALNGDSILLEYNTDHHVLIDGGYVDTYNTYLKPELLQLAGEGKSLDLIVVTHIDSDHISGIIKLFEEKKPLIPIKNVWHNSYRHIQSPVKIIEEAEFIHHNFAKEVIKKEAKQISAKQGSTLAALIQQNTIAWNVQFGGDVVSSTNSVKISNATFHILSPNQSEITALSKLWKKQLSKRGLLDKAHSYDFWDDAFDFYLSKDMPGFHFNTHSVSKTTNLQKLLQNSYVADTSATNGSSISFVMETDDKNILMLGDAHAETIIDSLKNIYGVKKLPYHFDAIKLSHHGSFNNNSPELISMIDSENWIISTNGDTYNHPNLETLAYIITKNNTITRKLYFNYNLTLCSELDTKELHENYCFRIIIPLENEPVIVNLE